MRPQRNDYPAYFDNYIPLVKQDHITDAITATKEAALALIQNLAPTLADYAYADGKWTVKQVLIHCTDTERIFSARALGFARGETQKALSFDENVYAAQCHAQSRSLNDIAQELEAVSTASLCLYRSFSDAVLDLKGEFPSGFTTVNAIGFTTCGHTLHHLQVLRERYLKINS